MRLAFFSSLMIISSSIQAATPIDGWYSSLFGGYAYIPGNVSTTHNDIIYNNVNYRPGYFGGGSLGYKSRPLRYEAEVTYFNANLKQFSQNDIPQNDVGGYNNAISGMANVYYDFPGILTCLEPFLGVGIGYAWINANLNNLSATDPSRFRITSSAFAYQGMAGISYNFAENYSIYTNYRYLGTPHLFDFGHVFQTHLANVGVTYRFDYARYQ